MERVISEFRLVETDDGYRLEVKGDKEAMRKAMRDFWQRRHAHHGFPHSPFGRFPGRHFRHWGGCCGPEEDPEGEKSE